MKVIFLDIDNVLNQDDGMSRTNMFDFHCVCILRSIVEMSGAKIVLSSSCRGLTPTKFIERAIGLSIYDTTGPSVPGEAGLARMQEIEDYLYGKDIDNYVILDDEVPEGPHAVRPEVLEGLRHKHIHEAIEILMGT